MVPFPGAGHLNYDEHEMWKGRLCKYNDCQWLCTCTVIADTHAYYNNYYKWRGGSLHSPPAVESAIEYK